MTPADWQPLSPHYVRDYLRVQRESIKLLLPPLSPQDTAGITFNHEGRRLVGIKGGLIKQGAKRGSQYFGK